MKTYRKDKPRRKRTDAAGIAFQSVTIKRHKKQRLQCSLGTRNSSRKDKTCKQNDNIPTNDKPRAQTNDYTKRSHRSSLASVRSVSDADSSASGSEKYIQQRKRMDDSTDEEDVSIQADADASGGAMENIKKKQNRETKIVDGDDQESLENGHISAKSSATGSGKKHIQQRKRMDDSTDEEEVSILADSDASGGAIKNIKKKKKRETKIVHGDDQESLENGYTSAKSSSTDSGKHSQQRKRTDDSSGDDEVSIQADSDASGGAMENIKPKRMKRETNIVHDNNQHIIEDGSECTRFMSDFDFMRARKKAESAHRRKRNDNRATTENEDLKELLELMKQAATQDRQLNLDGMPATKKIAILHKVMQQLIKKDLQHTLLNYNVLSVLAEWIAPLPNKALPCLQIRESILKLLADFPTIDKFYLKQSGIGKAVMYLCKHPNETKANRKRADVLIAAWFRSVYNISTDFSGMSREERRQRDLQQCPKQRKPSTQNVDVVPSKEVDKSDFWLFEANNKSIRPGDKGWINRARVPLPSDKVYIVRPKSKIEANLTNLTKMQPNRYEMYLKKFNDNKRKSTARPPVYLSIEGRKCCDY